MLLNDDWESTMETIKNIYTRLGIPPTPIYLTHEDGRIYTRWLHFSSMTIVYYVTGSDNVISN